MEAQMKINGEAVRALREQKSWSQEHLANASGLSVRTVQRAELENAGSAETRLALAAALDVPVADLILASPSTTATVEDGRLPRVVANSRFESAMRKTVLGLGVVAALAYALLVLFNVISGFAN
jgi:transcriptional regulator with XRE-family HTH domain